jgi:hypothetical protein
MSKGRQDRKKEGKTSTKKGTYMYKKKTLKTKAGLDNANIHKN